MSEFTSAGLTGFLSLFEFTRSSQCAGRHVVPWRKASFVLRVLVSSLLYFTINTHSSPSLLVLFCRTHRACWHEKTSELFASDGLISFVSPCWVHSQLHSFSTHQLRPVSHLRTQFCYVDFYSWARYYLLGVPLRQEPLCLRTPFAAIFEYSLLSWPPHLLARKHLWIIHLRWTYQVFVSSLFDFTNFKVCSTHQLASGPMKERGFCTTPFNHESIIAFRGTIVSATNFFRKNAFWNDFRVLHVIPATVSVDTKGPLNYLIRWTCKFSSSFDFTRKKTCKTCQFFVSSLLDITHNSEVPSHKGTQFWYGAL